MNGDYNNRRKNHTRDKTKTVRKERRINQFKCEGLHLGVKKN